MPDASAPPSHVRAFVAVPVGDAVQAGLAALLSRLRKALPGAALRWSRPEQIHLTLRFLGNISYESVAEVAAALQRASSGVGPFTLGAETLGCFPDSRNPRVLWVDVTGQTAALRRLQEQVQRETAAFGEPPETRPFQPHLTLARVKNATAAERRQIGELLARFRAERLGTWTVDRLELIRSELGAAGSHYTCLTSIPLVAT